MKLWGFIFILYGALIISQAEELQASFPEQGEGFIALDLGQAKTYLQKAIESGHDSLTINLAEVLFYMGEYEDALNFYRKSETLSLISTLQQKRNFTHTARLLNTTSGYESSTGYFYRDWEFDAKNMKPFSGNSAKEDFAPFNWNNILFVTSSRKSSRRFFSFSNKPFLNVYAFDENHEQIRLPDFLPRRLNTRFHDGPIAISADTNLVVITRNFKRPNLRDEHNLYLEYYVRENSRWSDGRMFPFSDDRYSMQHPWYDDKNQTLYFSSDMPGGYGGFDLYKAKWNGKEWETPVNLGPDINSPYDEVFPSLSPDGDLIYSTNHIETHGGLDIVLYRDGMRNLFPKPINSPYDDFAISFDGDSLGFFSTNRVTGILKDNIYVFNIPDPFPIEYNFFATVKDAETLDPVNEALVAFGSDEKNVFGIVITDEDGRGLLFRSAPDPGVFNFEVSKSGYHALRLSNDEFRPEDQHFNITFLLEQMPEIELITQGLIVLYFENDIPPIARMGYRSVADYEAAYNIYLKNRDLYFQNSINTREELDDFFEKVDSSMLKLRSFLPYLQEQLEAGFDFSIELTAYASPLATSRYNELLSRRRNASVKNFFHNQLDFDFQTYIDNERIIFNEIIIGDTKAPSQVSASRTDRQRSVYSVEASRERRVHLEWEMIPTERIMIADKPLEQISPVDVEPVIEEEIVEVELFPTHFIIVGSLRTMSRARELLRELEGKGVRSAGILESPVDGNFRVYHSAYQSRRQAINEIRQIRTDFTPDAWIFTKEADTDKPTFVATPSPDEVTKELRYYIIIGAFRNFSGAEATLQRARLQGIETVGILEDTPHGFYHVYFNSYPNLRQAREALNEVRRNISGDAWILRKK
ncbi:MAG: hypothetical protein EA393_04730 [Bacteroidetes bacterium]|nr:MAG: hypothetical protein EA393_04730 [Bacteroidota bacterium]